MGKGRPKDWIILRCASSQTLNLVTSLVDRGYEAWTPIEITTRWAGRPRKLVKQEVAAFVGYVFARSDRLIELIALSHSNDLSYRRWSAQAGQHLQSGVPRFKFLRHDGQLSFGKDDGLEVLRKSERQELAKANPVRFEDGETVCAVDGPCQGLTGKVEASRGEFTMVLFPGSRRAWMIATWQLASVHVSKSQPEQGIAA